MLHLMPVKILYLNYLSVNKISESRPINHFRFVDALIIWACLGLWRLMDIFMTEELKSTGRMINYVHVKTIIHQVYISLDTAPRFYQCTDIKVKIIDITIWLNQWGPLAVFKENQNQISKKSIKTHNHHMFWTGVRLCTRLQWMTPSAAPNHELLIGKCNLMYFIIAADNIHLLCFYFNLVENRILIHHLKGLNLFTEWGGIGILNRRKRTK